jgi:hypothetical protein
MKKPEISSFLLDSENEENGKIRGRFRREVKNMNDGLKFGYKDMLCSECIGDYIHCFKKEVVDAVKFPENIKRNDQIFYLEAAKKWDYFYIPRVGVYCYSSHSGRVTANVSKDKEDWISGIDFYLKVFSGDILKLCPKRMDGWLRSRAILCVVAGRKKEGIKYFLKALRYNFFSYKTWAYFILTIIRPSLIKWIVQKTI